MKLSFVFGGKQYQLDLHVLPGSTPVLFCHKDIDSMGLKYETMYKKMTRESDGYTEVVNMRNGLSFLIFPHPSYFAETQLLSMHRNLGHPSFDEHMKLQCFDSECGGPQSSSRLHHHHRNRPKRLLEK